MIKFIIIYFGFILFLSTSSIAQNTVGVINNNENAFNGYTLFTASTETYLINNCGQVINQWSSNYPPGNSVYLLENGNLLRACKITNPDVIIAGIGGRIELFDWDGNLLWEYYYSTSLVSQHHDVYPMPNGNILMLAATIMTEDEAIQAGRNPSSLVESKLYNEQILELEPDLVNGGANIIWEWNIKDHLIQDFDSSMDNFGIIEDNPQLLNINFLGSSTTGKANWLHFNSIQYNKDRDQIVISSRLLNEIYIIDHSTSTLESASHNGGSLGKGGDFLYRWGNPIAYKQGTTNDQKLFGQHYPYFIPKGLPNEGKIILFNNGTGRSPAFSEVLILTLPENILGEYSYVANTSYEPELADYTYIDPIDKTNFLSKFLSGAQQLINGNILICDGDSGYLFEIDANNNKVWEYINPVTNSKILSQGDIPNIDNLLFRATKYDVNYSAFINKDLTPGDPIELNSNLNVPCTILNTNTLDGISIYPNPTQSLLTIKAPKTIDKIEVYNILGLKIIQKEKSNIIDLSKFQSGIYFIQIYSEDKNTQLKIIKE